MGDHAASVAKQARKLAPYPPLGAYAELPGDGATDRLAGPRHPRRARRHRREPRRGRSPPATTRSMTSTTGSSRRRLTLMRADPANVDPGTRILFSAHYLERIGDRVTNIAEDIVFLATGEIVDLNP